MTSPDADSITRAANLLREDPHVRSDLEAWKQFLPGGARGLPSLLLEDFSDIPFLDGVHGVDWYQLRSRTRAGDGDIFVSTHDMVAGYEEYNQLYLGLGAPEFLRADARGADPLCVAGTCLRDTKVMARLVALAEEKGGLRIHPYMGSLAVWELAQEIRDRSQSRIEVLAPPPPAAYAANHKGLLSKAVTVLMGEDSLCKTVASNDLNALAQAAHGFFKRYPWVGLKMATYASAMGNRIYASEELCQGEVREIEARMAHFALTHHWDGHVEILLTEWRADVLQSPSTQLWIPPPLEGSPRVDGVFEQILAGRNFVFQGSMPSILPQRLQDRMAEMSLQVARVWQALGFVGRCSFDFVLCGKTLAEADPLFVECNGRWGGTSIPMSLVERIYGKGRTPFYRARDYMDDKLRGMRFTELVSRLGDSLYDARTGKGYFILYNVGCMKEDGKFDVISVGSDREEASRRLEEELPRLL